MDLTKILKHAPRGLKLYSTVHGEVEFECIDDEEDYPIITNKGMDPHTLSFNTQSFTKEGKYYLYENGDKYSWQEANVIEIPLSKLEEALHSSCHWLGLFGQKDEEWPDPCYVLHRHPGESFPRKYDNHPGA